MEKSNQSKENCKNQQTFVVKFVGTLSDGSGTCGTGIWTFNFNESLDEIKSKFQNGYIEFVEKWNIDELCEDECLDDYVYDENGFYEEIFGYRLRSDVWIFDENEKLVGLYTLSTQIHYYPGKSEMKYDWIRDSDLYECNG